MFGCKNCGDVVGGCPDCVTDWRTGKPSVASAGYVCPHCDNGADVDFPDANGEGGGINVCPTCNGTGKVKRFLRVPCHDRRVARGDDFAGDAWFDLASKPPKIVYSVVGHDRNT